MDFKENRRKLVNEIVSKDPKVIMVKGNTNPTYSSNSYSFILLDTGFNYIEFCGAYPAESDLDGFKIMHGEVDEWLNEIIKKFEEFHNQTLIKYNDQYLIFPILDENDNIKDYEYDYQGEIHLSTDGGGYVEILSGEF